MAYRCSSGLTGGSTDGRCGTWPRLCSPSCRGVPWHAGPCEMRCIHMAVLCLFPSESVPLQDQQGGLSVPAIAEFLQLWNTLEELPPLSDQPDQFVWTPSIAGRYSASSAYRCFFIGSTTFELAKRIWKPRAPLRCKVFLWLASLNRCWTADRLARGDCPIRLAALSVIKTMRPSSTCSPPVCLPGRSGRQFLVQLVSYLWPPCTQMRCSKIGGAG